MSHRIQAVTARENYTIEVLFFNGDTKQYDIKRLFVVFPQFQQLEESAELFEKVSVDAGGYGVSWNEELDLDAETIWEDGVILETDKKTDINHLLAYQISLAREKAHMTQKELSEKTGIYQADISKLERAIGNPSLSTLKRLADALDVDLQIDFVVRKGM